MFRHVYLILTIAVIGCAASPKRAPDTTARIVASPDTAPVPVAAPADTVRPVPAPVAAPVAAVPIGPLTLHASLSSRQLTLRKGSTVVAVYPIAIGRDEHPTPTGSFIIRRLVWNPRWVPPDSEWARNERPREPGDPRNPMKVVKIFFKEPDYYIHGTGERESLGRAASHGCLRMAPEQATEVARWIMEHGGEPRPEAWYRRILRIRSREQHVILAHPIPIEISG